MEMIQNDPIEILREIQDTYSVESVILEPMGSKCAIDVDERTITIPPDIKFFSVQYEHRANTIFFEIDRFAKGVDLTTQTGVIEFINGDLETGNVGFYPITEIDTNSPDKLLFTWKLHNDSTQIAGSLNFIVRFYTLNSDNTFLYNFVTLPGVGKILDTLDIDHHTDVEISPSLLAVWMERMTQTNNAVEAAKKIATDSAKLAEAYAKGRADMPGYETQNAKYYMEMTRTIRDDAKTAFETGKNEAIAAVNQAKDDGIQAMETAKNEAVQNVEAVIAESAETIKAQILEDIKTIKNSTIQAMETAKTDGIRAVEDAAATAVNTHKDEALTQIEVAKSSVITAIQNEGTEQLDLVSKASAAIIADRDQIAANTESAANLQRDLSALQNKLTEKFTERQITLLASDWSDSYPFMQTVQVEGITSQDSLEMIGLYIPDEATETDVKAIRKAAGSLMSNLGGTGDGTVTFKADKKPVIDFTLVVKGGGANG